MEAKKAQIVVVSVMAAVLLSLTVYSQSGIDDESKGFLKNQGLKALVGGYGGAAEGGDPSIIMTPDEDW